MQLLYQLMLNKQTKSHKLLLIKKNLTTSLKKIEKTILKSWFYNVPKNTIITHKQKNNLISLFQVYIWNARFNEKDSVISVLTDTQKGPSTHDHVLDMLNWLEKSFSVIGCHLSLHKQLQCAASKWRRTAK